ncbi:MAG TPA: vWA domain-containing protein, partial [Proteiniclasticum sp.]|nr:vWA domain-containing protein [Proteiniclasticum sp.]
MKTLENVAISLIIDKSGSMIDTDPNLMRETSANILIDLLSPEDYLGIISFSAEAQELHPMSGVGETGKDALKSKVTGNLAAQGDTDYLKAFDLAFRQMESIEDDNINKVIIFLTDGDPDPDAARRDEPGFMEGYMDSFWLKIKEIGLAGYTVHTVGLGTINTEVMDRLALETTGTSNEYSEPSDVAVAFFNIINQLKNRNEFLNLSEEVAGEKFIDFTMNEFVSQETFVIRNTNGPVNVDFIPPEGTNLSETLKMVKTENYTLATINQKETESTGSLKMKFTGNASVAILGAKDLFVKIWINSPIINSLHPIGEPLEIRATLTGTSNEDLIVEGNVLIDGVEALQPLSFVKDGEDYIGIFEDTQTRGLYEISLNVRLGEEIIAETTSSVSVKLLPAIKTDLLLPETGYVQGEKVIISTTLTLASTNLKVSDDLTLDYFELVQRNENDVETVITLVDDGVFENGDVKAEDGIFSGVLSYDELGDKEIIVRARGTYNGDIFILERNLGRTKVLPPGIVNITSENSSFELVKGEAAKLVLTLKSTSPY